MSWVNDAEDDEFIVHEPVPPATAKALKTVRCSILEISFLLAQGRKLGIVDPDLLSDRKIYIARAQAMTETMNHDTTDTRLGEENCEAAYHEAGQGA